MEQVQCAPFKIVQNTDQKQITYDRKSTNCNFPIPIQILCEINFVKLWVNFLLMW